jgi:hypothetical protein
MDLSSISFTDTLNGWAVGQGGIILHTSNGGDSIASEKRESRAPDDFSITPNPANPGASIRFTLSCSGSASVEIYGMDGRKTVTLLNNTLLDRGFHRVNFNTAGIPSGIYLCKLTFNHQARYKKVMIVK